MEPLEPELELGLLELEPGPKLKPELEPGPKLEPEPEPELALVPKLEPELVFGFRHALPYLVLLPSFPFRYLKYFSRQE